jgi:hypothetical protein
MTGGFTNLLGRNSTLTSLRITTAGNKHAYPQETRDDRVYTSWATFLASVRSTLVRFSSEQNEGHRNSAPPQASPNRPTNGLRPMDRFFVQRILPVLLEATWPRMQYMEIRGVGRSVQNNILTPVTTEEDLALRPDIIYEDASSTYPGYAGIRMTRLAFSENAQMRLHRLLGDGVELIIDEWARRSYEDVDEADTSIPPVWRAASEQCEDFSRTGESVPDTVARFSTSGIQK